METTCDILEVTKNARDVAEEMMSIRTGLHPVNVRGVVEDEVERAEDRFAIADFEVRELPDLEVEADGMLSSVFRNLLNNAVQHNDREEPIVEVSAEEREDTVVVSVADNGPGVPDDEKDQIFGKDEKGLESPGIGVGLYLAHTTTERYGGDVRVRDNEPEGAVFEVELRRAGSEDGSTER
ncbi:MAG: Methanogenesis regulatory histidine kinase FilI [Methanonatronarchaeales archaeon]|nr:Methanogenesis regulatory histidine kinase FilI [Methanonatronarchaeales archaeon]